MLMLGLNSRTAQAESPKELSLTDCLNLARSQSLQTLQSSFNVKFVEASRHEIESARRPSLSGVGAFEKSDDVNTQLPDANKAVLRLEQTALPFTSSWIRANQKQFELRAAEFAHLESELDVSLLVKQLYFSILRDQDAILRLNEVEVQLKALLNSLIPRYSIGRTLPFDIIKIKSSLSDLVRTQELTEAQLDVEKTQLAQLIRLSSHDGSYDKVSFKTISNLPKLAFEDANPKSVEANPSIHALTEQLHAAEIGVTVAKANRYPSFIGAFEYGYTGQSANDMNRGWSLTFGLKLPLFDWGMISSQIAQESTNTQISRVKYEIAKEKAALDLNEALGLAKAHLADRNRLQALIPETKKASLISIDRYKRGAVGILEASEATNLWIQTLLGERSSFYNFLTDLAKIDRLRGTSEYESL